MKKSVVLLIFVIYVASIFVVGFLGIKATAYNETVNVEGIKCMMQFKEKDKDLKALEDPLYVNDTETLKLTYSFERTVLKSDIESGGYRFDLLFGVVPENATNTNIEYIYEEPVPDASGKVPYELIDNNDGSAYIMFYSNSTKDVYVTIRSEEKNNIGLRIKIRFFRPRNK